MIRTITLGIPNDRMGQAIARVGDVDGDGLSELAVSSVNGAVTPPVQSVRLVSAASGAFLQLWSDGPTYTGYGTSLAGPGNFDGDAVSDFVVGAANPVSATPPGYIRTYSTTGVPPLMTVFGALDPFGGAVFDACLVGDLDSDGVSDLSWAAYPNVGFSSGATGASLGAFDISAANGGSLWNYVRLAALGDVNGDQVPDVLASTHFDILGFGLGSRAFIVSGSTFQAIHTITQSGPCTIQGTAPVCALGDQDSDGVTDFAIGFTGCTSASSTGEVRIHSGQTGALIRAIPNVGTGSVERPRSRRRRRPERRRRSRRDGRRAVRTEQHVLRCRRGPHLLRSDRIAPAFDSGIGVPAAIRQPRRIDPRRERRRRPRFDRRIRNLRRGSRARASDASRRSVRSDRRAAEVIPASRPGQRVRSCVPGPRRLRR